MSIENDLYEVRKWGVIFDKLKKHLVKNCNRIKMQVVYLVWDKSLAVYSNSLHDVIDICNST